MKTERSLIILFILLAVFAWSSLFIVRSPVSCHTTENNKSGNTSSNNYLSLLNNPVGPAVNNIFASPGQNTTLSIETEEANSWESQFYDIQLKGTAGSEIAVIQDRDGTNERIVHINDLIGQAKIISIQRNILEISGPLGKETLILPSGSTKSNSDSNLNNKQDRLQIINRQQITDMLSQVDRLSEEITIQPVRHADGTSAGFKISSIKPMGTLAKMGLRRNDTLTLVNRQQIVSIEDIYRVLESATHKSKLSLTILRDNQKMELNYVLR